MNIYDILNELNIKYDEVEHDPIFTVNDAFDLGISNNIDGVECKNLFVKCKDNYYIVFIDSNKKADLKSLSKLVNEKKFSFATTNELKEILNLDIGSVTPLGIINDKHNVVSLLIDKDLVDKRVLVHPNVNSKTLSLYFNDLIRFIEYTKHKYYLF